MYFKMNYHNNLGFEPRPDQTVNYTIGICCTLH